MQKQKRIAILLFTDIILISATYLLSFYLRFDLSVPKGMMTLYIDNIIIITLIKIIIFSLSGIYNSLWRYASIDELVQIIKTTIIANAAVISYMYIRSIHFPRSIYLMTTILDIMLIGGVRFSYRVLRRMKNDGLNITIDTERKRVMIVGAGDAGAMVIKEFKNHKNLNSDPVVLIDDDKSKEGRKIHGVQVRGQRYDIRSQAIKNDIDEIVIAMPSASKSEIKEILEECKETKCKVKTLPGIYELIDGKISIKQLRNVKIEDLLGRDEIILDTEQINEYIRGKRVLITGGGGSIGSELCRQIARFLPKELVILDIYENNAYDLQNELKRKYEDLNLKVIIASIRDNRRINSIVERLRPNVIFHAAAHKHVPLMESNPHEAVKNNIFGTFNVVRAADKYGVDKFVMISTDKAVNPTNIMGATKRLCEMIIQSIDKVSNTEFVAVRFGNVLGSNGSVIPLFKKQIAEGGPVTVTHEDIIRYFMTIPEASQLVLQAGAMANGGEIFVLDMGDPVKIIDLARDLIRLSGFEPDKEIPIKIVGLRPGEKLYEELLMDEEGLESTTHEKIFIGQPIFSDYKVLIKKLRNLEEAMCFKSNNELKKEIGKLVPTYKRPEDINNVRKLDIDKEIVASKNSK
ncbi:polysaccharide biosynthesis protein [Clostridium sp. D2Q-14]|uniref:polysaccharide biosynthesis protein n=1 Tax=Anaeromonas gelatinilytica TaxID=2683194 RepID=UPI00193B8029|nr:nucleoside-diphosphate sugar epimerase/dehydratase [Anaeromonas gelatinilytica]MBS4534368.1 polysaccharide biosynthesis protein [Anaeromonas gelatinilytica]